jgi:lysophospholipase L1-like esterase
VFRTIIFAIISILPISGFACPQPMPTTTAAIEVEDFDLGSCWLRETLQNLNKKGKKITEDDGDLLSGLLAELVDYIPSEEQAKNITTQLMTQITRTSPNLLRSTSLTALGQFHVLTPAIQAYVLAAIQDKDDDVRASALEAAAQINPKDPAMQKVLLRSLLNDSASPNRSAALDGIYLRSPEAIAAITTVAKDKRDKFLQGQAQSKLEDWTAHPLPDQPSSKSMAILGDSISVGFFADTSLLEAAKYKVEPKDLNVLWFVGQSKHDEQMSRVWAGGDKITSHFGRIKSELKSAGIKDDVELMNFARAGATTPHLLGQIAVLHSKMLLEPEQQLIYVTLFMGSNDVCNGTTPDVIAKNLTRALARLNRLPHKTKLVVLLSSVPPIHQLGSPLVANFPAVGGLTCQAVQRDHLKFCNAFSAPASPADYDHNQKQVEETNQKIAAVAYANQQLSNLQIVFSASLGQSDIKPELLAFDCFHPNEQGQQAISDALWNDLKQAAVSW